MKVLVVDDEIGICQCLQRDLQKEGYEVEYVTSAIDVLERLKSAEREGKGYDLLLLDLHMPQVDSLSLLMEIQQAKLDLDVVVTTGSGDEGKVIESIRLGAVDYLRKPISPGDLRTSLFRVEQRQASREERTKTLRESEERYRTLFKHVGTALAVIEEDTTISLVNEEFERLSGYSREEIEGKKSWTEFVAFEDLKRMKEYHSARRKEEGKAPASYEFKFVDREGNVKEIYLGVGMIRGTKKSLASLMDITERRRAEEALQESEEKYRNIVENARDVIIALDLKGDVLSVNRAVAEYGFKEDELVGKNMLELVAKKYWPRLLKELTKIARGGPVEGEIAITTPKGEKFAEYKSNPMRRGKRIVGFQTILRDITERKRAEEELREREEKYRALIEQSNDAIYLLYGNKFELINPKFEELFGVTPEEVRAPDFDFRSLVAPQSLPVIEERERKLARGEEVSPRYEFTALDKRGNEIEVEVSVSYVPYRGGTATQGILHDITERKRVEETLRVLNAAAAAIQRAARTPEAVFTTVMEQLQTMGFTGAVALLDGERKQFTIRYTALASQVLAQAEKLTGIKAAGYAFPVKQLAISQQVLAGKAVFVPDVVALFTPIVPTPVRPLMPTIIRMVGTSRSIVAPLSVEGKIIGILGVSAARMTEADIPAIAAFANQMAAALENARLFEAERRRQQELEALREISLAITSQLGLDKLLQNIVEQGRRLLGVNTGGIYLVDETRGDLQLVIGHGYKKDYTGTRLAPGEGLAGRVLQSGKPLAVDDYQRWEGRLPDWEAEPLTAVLGLPLKYGEQAVGVLEFAAVGRARRFDQHDNWLATLFAGQAAIAIGNARLFKAEQRRVKEMEVLQEISLAITSQLGLDKLLQNIVEQGCHLLDVKAGGIYLVDEKRGGLELAVSHGYSKDYTGARLAPGEGLAGRALQSGELLAVDDYQHWEGRSPDWEAEPLTAVLSVPLKSGEQVVGVLDFAEMERARRFDQRDNWLATLFASQAAIAIENARLFKAEQRRVEEMEALREISLAITSQLGFDKLLQNIVEQGRRLLNVNGGDIYLVDERRDDLVLVVSDGYSRDYVGTRLAPGEGVAGRVLQSGTPLTVDDYHHWEARSLDWEAEPLTAVLSVPLKRGERIIGTMGFTEVARARSFDQHDIWLATLFASQAVIAIENARLFKEERQRAEEMEALQEISLAITSQLGLDKLLQNIVEQGCRLLDVKAGGVFLVDEKRGGLELAVSHGYSRDYTGAHLVPGEGLAGRVLQGGEPLTVNDYHHWEGRVPDWEAEPLTAVFSVPLKSGEQVVGVLDFAEIGRARHFDQHDIWLATLFAGQAAIAIENARLFQAEQEQRKLAEALEQATAVLSSTLQPEEVLNRILEQVGRVVPNDAANIMLIGDNDEAHIIRWRGYGRFGAEESISATTFHISEVQDLQQMRETGEPEVIPDTAACPGWIHVPEQQWLRSYAAAPIVVRGEVIGFLNVDSATPGFFTEAHLGPLRAFASHAAAAIENAHLFEAERRRAEEMEALAAVSRAVSSTLDLNQVLNTIAAHAVALSHSDEGGIFEFDKAEGILRVVASYNASQEFVRAVNEAGVRVGEGAVGRAVATGEPAQLVDTETEPGYRFRENAAIDGIRSILAVPMFKGEELLGGIVLWRREPGAFSSHDVGLLSTLADHAAVAIEKVRLYEETRQRATELGILFDVATSAASSIRLDEVLNRSLTALQETMHPDDIAILLVEPETNELVTSVSTGFPGGPKLMRRPIGVGIPGWVVQTGQPLLLDDVRQSEHYSACDPDTRSEVCVPLRVGERVIGALNLESHHLAAFGEDDLRLLSILASHLSNIIENARLFDEVRQHAESLSALYQIGKEINTTLELDRILDTICEEAMKATDAATADVALVDLEQGFWKIRAIRGLVEDWKGREISLDTGIHGRVFRTGEPAIISDVRQAKDYYLVGDPRVRSELAVPILLADKVVGAVNLESMEFSGFDENDLRFVQALAEQATIAIKNARLFQAEREQRELAEALERAASVLGSTLETKEVLDRILEHVGRVVPNDAANIMLIEGDNEAHIVRWRGYEHFDAEGFVSEATFSIPEVQTLRQMRETGKPMVIPDTATYPGWFHVPAQEWLRSYAAAPIVVRGEVIGFLNVDSTTPGFFTQAHLVPLQAFASHAAAAIENARLFEAERQRAEEMEALAKVSRAVSSTLDLDQVLKTIASYATILSHSDEGGIFELDKREGVFRITASYNASQEFVRAVNEADIEVGEGAIGRAAAAREPVQVVNSETEPGYPFRDIAAIDGIHSNLAVPMFKGEELLGGIVLWRREPGAFSSHDVGLLSTLADHAAVAVENVRLYQAEQRRREEAETLRQAALALTTSLDSNQVVERILMQLREVVPYDSASVQLLRDNLLEIIGGHGFSNLGELLGMTFDLTAEGNPNREVMRTRAPFIVEDATAVYREFSRKPHAQAGIRSWLGVPMLVGERLVGMIALDKHEPGFYTEEHARLAQAFAAQAAVAIENARLFEAEREQRELAGALEEATAVLSSTLQPEEVLDRILEQVGRVVPNDAANITLVKDDEARVVRWRGYGRFRSEEVVSMTAFRISETNTFRQMRETKKPLIVSDTATYPDWVRLPEQEWLRSYAAAPIVVRDEVIGFLNVDSATPGFFTQVHLGPLQAFADHAAAALENARLYQAEQAARERADTLREISRAVGSTLELDEVLSLVLRQAKRVLTYDTASVLLFSDGQPSMAAVAGYEDEELVKAGVTLSLSDSPILQTMARDRRPIVIPDVREDKRWIWVPGAEDVRAWTGAPLLVRGEMIGVLMIDSKQPGSYTEVDAAIAQALANQVAVAIENARLFTSLAQEKERLELLYRLSRHISESLDVRQVAQRALDDMCDVMGAMRGIAAVYEPDNNRLQMMAISGYDAESVDALDQRLRLRLGNGLIGWAAAQRQSVLVDDVTKDSHWLPVSGVDDWVRSALSVPLLSGDELLGAFSIYSDQEAFFNDEHRRLGESIAATVAVAIANARLYEETMATNAKLEEALRLREELVQNVSHELRTPLTLVRGYAELILSGTLGNMTPEQEEALQLVVRKARDLNDMVNDLLMLKAPGIGLSKQEVFDLRQLVSEMMQEMKLRAEEAHVTFTQDFSEDIPMVKGNREYLRRVVGNLLGNAIKFSPDGGPVTVRIQPYSNKGEVLLSVSDMGVGIPPDKLDKIFERFYQIDGSISRKFSGAGIGLALVREIVAAYGGRVWAESEGIPGKGSTFFVVFPAVEEKIEDGQ